MGGERWKKRQHLYLCLAGLILVCSGACIQHPNSGWHLPPDRWDHLQPVQARIDNRDFDGAVNHYHKILSQTPGSADADLALFDLGLLYSHYANPRKDYKRSLSCFNRLVKEYPRSPLMEQAKIWVNLLETIEKTQRVDLELEEQRKY